MTLTPARLRRVSDSVHVWLPPRRGWGLANCGLVSAGDEALLVDTPYDHSLARTLLKQAADVLPPGVGVSRIAVTHANGDHLWGAGALPEAEVVATREALHHIDYEPSPAQLHALVTGGAGPLGDYLRAHFGAFDWSTADAVRPDTVIDAEHVLSVGGVTVRLIPLPPAHTTGDLMVHLPDEGVVFTGDVVFASTDAEPGDHPVHWAGPLDGVMGACRQALDTGADTFVPGHGPLLDRSGLLAHIDYLAYVRDRAHAHHARGRTALEAARSIVAEARYPRLALPERLVVTVSSEYRHLDGTEPRPMLELFVDVVAVADEGPGEA